MQRDEDGRGAPARQQLEEVVFPFWLSRGIDHRRGGFFTCFDNRGVTLKSTHKFTWSQGRFVWVLARAARLAERGLLSLRSDELLSAAQRGAEFLLEHAVRPDGTCAYVLDERGRRPPGTHQDGDRSVYADCFVAMGLAELSRQTGSPAWVRAAAPIIARATADVHARTAPTAPYPVPAELTAFGPRMILLNTRLDQVRALRAVSLPWAAELSALAAARVAVLSHRLPDGTFAEMFRTDGRRGDTLLETHRTPGHALEAVWMAVEASDLLTEPQSSAGPVESARALCASAWDHDHGGLFRYVGVDNVETATDAGAGVYETLVRRTWSTKLWWVHSEALYTTALLARRYRASDMAAWFDRIWQYTMTTFPAGVDGHEWIQIRDRQGKPLDEVVALPVKDPYHVARNLMQLVELYADRKDAHQ